MKVKIEKVEQVNVFEGDNNKAYYNSQATKIDYELMKVEICKLISICSSEDLAILEEAKESLSKKNESGFKIALKKLVDIGSSVLAKVSSDIFVAYMRSHGILP